MTKRTKLETLAINQGLLTKQIKQLKKQGGECFEACSNRKNNEDMNCVERAFQDMQLDRQEDGYYESLPFDHYWGDALADGDACSHCVEARSLRKLRMRLVRRLASVRAAITRIGSKMAKEDGQA